MPSLSVVPFIGILTALILLSCSASGDPDPAANPDRNTPTSSEHVASIFASDFEQLPEKAISISLDATVFAQYAGPTERYPHGILGDKIEAAQLVVWQDGRTRTASLSDRYVFEDIAPRLADVDGDGNAEVVTIRTDVTKGAGIMIYKIVGDALTEFAWVTEIGIRFRWLNIAAIYDLEGNGTVELAWVETPHIGGTLKVATIQPGRLVVQAVAPGFSNHAIGERNLCLSVVTQGSGGPTLYVPTQDRSAIVGFQLVGGSLQRVDTVNRAVDFGLPLTSQHDFADVVQGGQGCPGP